MSARGDQNGRQPPLPAAPSLPSRTENVNEAKEICRDFVWGACTKNATCKFRHELVFEDMKRILKFCHDYQNRAGCSRKSCTYLHATRDEENLFLATGQLPRVLAERHAAMSSSTSVETITQIAMFIRESYVPASAAGNLAGPSGQTGHPPVPPGHSPVPPGHPPVPPGHPPVPPGPPPVPPGPPPVPPGRPPVPPGHPPPLPRPAPPPTLPLMPTIPLSIRQPPPPPPPPPPTVPSTVTQTSTSVYTAPPPPPLQGSPITFPISQPPPPLPVMFVASKPPPLLPSKSGTGKHKTSTLCEVGPSKIRKTDDTNVGDTPCENCVQQEIRLAMYMQELDALHCEDKYQTMVYEKNLKQYETGKELLRTLVNADLYMILEEHIEGVPQIQLHDILSQLNSSFDSGMSTVPKQFLLQLMDCFFNNTRSLIDSEPSSTHSIDESFLQSLTSMPSRNSLLHLQRDNKMI